MSVSSSEQPAQQPSAHPNRDQPSRQWYSWGSGAAGLLAHGNTGDCHTPTIITAPPITPSTTSSAAVASLACSGVYSLLCTSDGELWHCGDTHQSCSLPGTTSNSQLLLLPARIALSKRIVSVACGWSHCGCISDDGELYMWGNNKQHQLSIALSDQAAATASFCHTPTLVPLPAPVLSIACGWRHTLALTRSHQLLGWGENRARQLSPAAAPSLPLPTPLSVAALPATSHLTSVHCGWRFSLLVASCGRVYCCGDNKHGQCGVAVSGGVKQVDEWTEVAGVRAIRAAVGWTHCLLLDEGGSIFTFGRRSMGQAGTGRHRAAAGSCATPERVTLPTNVRITDIACGSESCLCIDSDGGLWSWGWNEHGNVGSAAVQKAGEDVSELDVEENVVWLPRRVGVAWSAGKVFAVAAGGASVFAAVADVTRST